MIFPFLEHFNTTFTLVCVFPAIIFLGLFLSWRLRFPQFSKMKMSLSHLVKKGEGEGSISHYQAISAVLAGNFGTGNISGMAIALALGGPGALVWMWVMAFLGSVIQYSSCLLGVKYRQKNRRGEFVGGPMYYLREGLGWKKMAALFSMLTVVAAIVVGNFVQVNSISLPLAAWGISPAVCGCVMAVLVALVMLGGIGRIAKVSASVVPVMAVIYLGTALVILGMNFEGVGPALVLMFKSAFGGMSLVGGAAGYGMMRAVTMGFDRGIFATDAGTGIVPILQAGARSSHPVIDGVVTLVAPFLVMIVCTATGLVLLVTGAWTVGGLESTNMVTHAFSQGIGSDVGHTIVLVSLTLFAYTTILAWGNCGEKAVAYLFGGRGTRLFRLFFILLVPVGAFMQVGVVWMLADLAITAMLFINLIGIAGLSKEVVADSRDFFFEKIESSLE